MNNHSIFMLASNLDCSSVTKAGGDPGLCRFDKQLKTHVNLPTIVYLIDPRKRKVTKMTLPDDQMPLPIVDNFIRGDSVSLRDFAGDKIFADLHKDMSPVNFPFLVINGGLVFGNAVIVATDWKTPENSIRSIKRRIKFFRPDELDKEFGSNLERYRWDGYSKDARFAVSDVSFLARLLNVLCKVFKKR